jgi:hypothetical protein
MMQFREMYLMVPMLFAVKAALTPAYKGWGALQGLLRAVAKHVDRPDNMEDVEAQFKFLLELRIMDINKRARECVTSMVIRENECWETETLPTIQGVHDTIISLIRNNLVELIDQHKDQVVADYSALNACIACVQSMLNGLATKCNFGQ